MRPNNTFFICYEYKHDQLKVSKLIIIILTIINNISNIYEASANMVNKWFLLFYYFSILLIPLTSFISIIL